MLLALAARALAADPNFAGPGSCRPCHPAEYTSQSKSHHFAALRPIAETRLGSLLADAPIRERSGVAFEYKQRPGALLAVITKGRERAEAPLLWAFGAGAQAYTPVGFRSGSYFEHRVSYYTSAQRPALTLGHPSEASKSAEAALGMAQKPEIIYQCFNCHATGVRPGPDLDGMLPGVSCERCHGPGAAHVKGAQSMAALSKLSPLESVQFCAQCHRSSAAVEDALSIRFQPLGLMASQCFRKSRRLSCTTCHNPHENVRHDAEFYVVRCIGCHAKPGNSAHCGMAERRNCLPCHMPRSSPADFLAFTDHRIRKRL